MYAQGINIEFSPKWNVIQILIRNNFKFGIEMWQNDLFSLIISNITRLAV
jgi:hypothetical protein